MKKSLLFVFVAVLTALILFSGCPTGSSTDGGSTGGTDSGGGGGGGGGNGLPGGTGGTGPTDTDSPSSGSMSEATATQVFDWTIVGDAVQITRFKSTTELVKYLGGTTASLQYGGSLLSIAGGTGTLDIKSIGTRYVASIAANAFSPGTGTSYDPLKDITLVVSKITLPDTITSLGTDLFVWVKATVAVDIPAAVIETVTETATPGDQATKLGTIIGNTDAVTVIKGGSTDTPIIEGDPVLEAVNPTATSDGKPLVTFTFDKAVTTVSGLSWTGITTGTLTATASGKTVSVASDAVEPGQSGTITFTAATASGKSVVVTETVGFGGGTTTNSDVQLSTTATTTTPGLTIASATKTGNTHVITLAGTGIAIGLPAGVAADFTGVTNSAVITLTGILIPQEASRIQQTNPAFEQYVIGSLGSYAGSGNFGATEKTQAEIETAFTSDPAKAYFWKTASPVTYNKLKNYAASPDGDLSILLQPTPAGKQTITIIKKAGAPEVTTTYTIDYSAVSFDVSTTVALSTTSSTTTTGLTVASAVQTGGDVAITLAGTNIDTTNLPSAIAADFANVTDCAAITLNGILITNETARIQQANPALHEYVDTTLGDYTDSVRHTTAKTQAEIEALYNGTGGDAKTYFWKTAAPVTYNKLRKYTNPGDGDLSILVQPYVAGDVITLVKIDDRGTTTYTINYSGVTFTP
jgi:hypothetical protein